MRIEKIAKALLIFGALTLAASESHAYITHVVGRSETLWGIAHNYKVSSNDIINANPGTERGLKVGQKLRIPEPQDLQPDTVVSDPQPQQGAVQQPESQHPESEANTPNAQLQQPTQPAATTPQRAQQAIAVNDGETSASESLPNTVYVAKFGDSLHSVSKKTGISVNDLLKYNPLVDPDDLGEGYIVRLSADAPYLTNKKTISLIDSIIYRVEPPQMQPQNQGRSMRTIAVMLPFDVENETISRHSYLATDFYKGFLMALKANTGNGDMPIRIIAMDTQCDSLAFAYHLQNLMIEDVSVIIPPEDESQLDAIEQFALQHDILVLNALNIKDEGYQRYPNILQCNINQKLMYAKAIDALIYDYADYTPVILEIVGAKDDKGSFIEELRQRYQSQGRQYINMPVTNRLTAEEISKLPPNGKYIFIPKSGTSEVFAKFAEALAVAIDENTNDSKYKLFGYPDWITYKGEHEEMLHRMGAIIYSRFFIDPTDPDTEDVNQEFVKWYGNQMEDVYPSQGMLGYDIGNLLFTTLKRQRQANDFSKFEDVRYRGRQSTFHFVDDGESAGRINDALYIIEYLPGTGVYARVR